MAIKANNEDVTKKEAPKKGATKKEVVPPVASSEEEAKDVGLFGSIKGRIVSDGVDHLHPEDLARYELFRVKKEVAQTRRTLLAKEERILAITLQNMELQLRTAKLEHDLKRKNMELIINDTDDQLNIAKRDFANFSEQICDKYDIEPESLIYDDISGKLVDI